MRSELYAGNPKTVIYGTETMFFLSPKICALIPQNISHKNIIDSNPLLCFKIKPTAHVVYAKYFCDMLVLYSSTAVLPSQFLV